MGEGGVGAQGAVCEFVHRQGESLLDYLQSWRKVDKNNPTEFGHAMAELGITMIAGYSPQARGRCERVFRTLRGRLPRELEEAGITEMEEANKFVEKKFLSAHNRRFMTEPMEEGSDFVELLGAQLDDILREEGESGRQRRLRELQGETLAGSSCG